MITGTTEELLALILQQMSPCPDVCNNVDPYGSDVYDIRSGLRIPELKEPPCYCYTITTPSGTTADIEYINCSGSTVTLGVTGPSVDNVCIKKITSYAFVPNNGTLVKNQVCGYGGVC